ncbi:MAG: Rieske 2Fe-2S domain-containing protein [Pseudomonadota bacterium]
MSVAFIPVQWNRSKWVYDAVLLGAVFVYIAAFLHWAPGWTEVTRPVDTAILRARAFGSCAFFMLTVILCIGPLARLDRRWLPLLYNRRHFGVMTCLVALAHAGFVLDWYFAFSELSKAQGLLVANTSFGLGVGFPFEVLGLFALLVLAILATTSHDVWLSFLGAPVWKALHMLIYPAYAAVVGHVAFGALQDQTNPLFAVAVGLSAGLVAALHWAAREAPAPAPTPDGPWEPVCPPDEIPESEARIAHLSTGERVAVFRHKGRLSAISNACAHQNGPLGEGRVIGGCVTCPWHGFQYRLEDGRSPAPFTETVPTYHLRLSEGLVWVDNRPNPPGTAVEPLALEADNENA